MSWAEETGRWASGEKRMKPRELETPGVLLMKPVISLEGGKQDCATISEPSKGAFPSLRTHLTLERTEGLSLCAWKLKEVCAVIGWK